jgi:hypothetical protein
VNGKQPQQINQAEYPEQVIWPFSASAVKTSGNHIGKSTFHGAANACGVVLSC